MALTQRQMSCFERNSQFQNEVAAALLQIAAGMKAQALVDKTSAEETLRTFAAIRERVADQILAEQGISLQPTGGILPAVGQATTGSQAMKYLIQQMLLMPTWTLTPDAWADNEMVARATIQGNLAALLQNLTAIPVAPQALQQTQSTKEKAK